jgi:hypothetical protein
MKMSSLFASKSKRNEWFLFIFNLSGNILQTFSLVPMTWPTILEISINLLDNTIGGGST